jgi:hypothetical protein
MTFLKDPQALLDFSVDWTSWLGSDTIATSTWTVPTGLTKVSDSKTTEIATVWLSGGTVGQEYTVTNHIKTAAGREDERSIIIQVQER